MKVKRKGNVILIIVISLILSTSNIFADSVVKENYVGSSRESISITNVDEVNVKVEKEQALNLAKETISKYFNCNVDKTFDERIELYEDDYPVKAYLWNISWDKYNNEEDYHISIRINTETSKVISVHKYFYEHDKVSEIPTIVKKDAKKISDNFLKTFNKELVNEVKYVEDYNKDYHSKDYSFRYVRCHNGLMFDKNHIRITVDGTTGKVISYSENWDYNIEFEKVDDIKSEKLIQDLFYNNIDMNLVYLSDDRGCESVNKVRLVYKREYNDSKNFIDAKTGEFIQYDSKRDTNELSKDEIEKLTLGRSIKRDNKNKLTINEAKEIIEKYSKELLTDYTIESITYWKDSNCNKENDEIYRAELLKGNKKDRYHICLSIDAYTGEIIYYDNYRFEIMDSELKTNSVKSWDECYDIAIRTVAKYYPDKIDQINTKQEYYKSDDYNDFFNFSFNRQINGINYDRDSINVEINGLNGEVVHLTYDWNTNITFPSIDKDKIIDSKKAKEIFFKEYKPVLVYNKGKNDKKVKVIYKLHKECEHPFRYSLIDANSGKLIDYSGKEKEEPKDNVVSNHWAKKELNIFQSQNYIDIAKIDVNKSISYKELIKLVSKVKDYEPYMYEKYGSKLLFTNVTEESEIYPYLQFAVQQKILENKAVNINLDKKVTREQLAKIIIKSEYLDKAGKISEIYNVDKIYTDAKEIDKDLLGYVALSYGLDIMKGNNGKFDPKKEVTYAEAIVVIYKSLVK